MNDTEAVAIRDDRPLQRVTPREIIAQATEEAEVLASVIDGQKLYSMIQGKKFVKVEGWVTLATLRGMLPREVSVVEMPEGRYVAEVELVRMSDGMVLTKASAECGGPEDHVWQSRPPNARRSMAITRATGKACRVAFSWVMALSGFEVTPLEEMPENMVEQPQHSDNSAARAVSRQNSSDEYIFEHGKHKGKSIRTVPLDYIQWYMGACEENIQNPDKAKFKAENKAMLDRLLNEIQRRAQNANADEPPHPAEIPF